jgi:hypothetical protein
MTNTLTSNRNPESETRGQMELGLGNSQPALRASRHTRRSSRGAWWFAHMRQIVDRAMDWPAAAPRPEQIWLPGSTRQVRV